MSWSASIANEAVLLLGGNFSSREFEHEITVRLQEGLDDRVRFLGPVPHDDVPRYLASAEVLWNAALPSAQFSRPTVATKDFEAAAVGLAVLEATSREEKSLSTKGLALQCRRIWQVIWPVFTASSPNAERLWQWAIGAERQSSTATAGSA